MYSTMDMLTPHLAGYPRANPKKKSLEYSNSGHSNNASTSNNNSSNNNSSNGRNSNNSQTSWFFKLKLCINLHAGAKNF